MDRRPSARAARCFIYKNKTSPDSKLEEKGHKNNDFLLYQVEYGANIKVTGRDGFLSPLSISYHLHEHMVEKCNTRMKSMASTRRDDWGGGREPFKVDSFHATPIDIRLNAKLSRVLILPPCHRP